VQGTDPFNRNRGSVNVHDGHRSANTESKDSINRSERIYYLSKWLYLTESDCSSMFSCSSLPGLAPRGNGKISDRGSTLEILAADSLSGGVWHRRRTCSIFERILCFLSADFSNAAPFRITQSLINISLRSPAWKFSEHSSSIENHSSRLKHDKLAAILILQWWRTGANSPLKSVASAEMKNSSKCIEC